MKLTVSLTALFLIALFYILYIRRRTSGAVKAIIKCVPTLSAFGLALYGALGAGAQVYVWLICLGLTFCVAADYVLEFRFIPGAALFALAHVCFIVAFFLGGAPGLCSVLLAVCLFLILCTLFLRFQSNKPAGTPMAVFLLYAAVLSLMAGASAAMHACFFAGAMLFVVSDTLLGLRLFHVLRPRSTGIILMASYYLALYLIALGCVVV